MHVFSDFIATKILMQFSRLLSLNLYLVKTKKNFMASFYEWVSTASRLEPLRGGSLLFTTKFPEIPGTHFIDLGGMKDWVELGATQWFWKRNPTIGNPAPEPLGHWSNRDTEFDLNMINNSGQNVLEKWQNVKIYMKQFWITAYSINMLYIWFLTFRLKIFLEQW